MVGSAAAPTTYLLAAHDAAVTFLAGELGSVERVESRMAAEALSSLFESYVTQFDPCLPEFLNFLEGFDIVIIDPGVLLDLKSACRNRAGRRPAATQPPRRSPRAAAQLRRDCPGRASLPLPRLERRKKLSGASEALLRRPLPELILSKPCPGDTA